MGIEIEIKLLINRSDIDALLAHPLLVSAEKRPLHHCYSLYYDTLGHQLVKKGYALRLRHDAERFVQTLKSAGRALAGLHERQEWEWEVANDQLDLQLLPDEVKPFVKQLDLQPVFVTDFSRQCWNLSQDNHLIEVALDRGEVRSGPLSEPICEVELEIKTGDKTGLIALAKTLKETVKLKPFDVSKAERGYRLHTIHQHTEA